MTWCAAWAAGDDGDDAEPEHLHWPETAEVTLLLLPLSTIHAMISLKKLVMMTLLYFEYFDNRHGLVVSASASTIAGPDFDRL